ncbi:vacuolar fusion protein MON1 homolog [Selaginella moellendorffii]|uniref:vacuolar fusion protein MON1 homolog n=1 Tax=Selaginella moellendorffii TaxID=88036 RepID=UPI000D1CB408|nr:vacuolar fusion protein MON1 homolog [Selaginella moellendorffii]|eukprot:XP_024535970.1 vacuolar fusion protein MON1 homolog [Selaginella moellendorffii]
MERSGNGASSSSSGKEIADAASDQGSIDTSESVQEPGSSDGEAKQAMENKEDEELSRGVNEISIAKGQSDGDPNRSSSGESSGTNGAGGEEIARRVSHDGNSWVPGKRHADEDDSSESWRKHKKHFFVLSNAGKPIYSRYGDEHKLAGFSATLQAIMSFVITSGDCLQLVRAGNHQIVFLVKGPLYLVSINSTEEPYQAMKRQLELLHGQLFLILTKAVERCFAKHATFDMKTLLGGTDIVLSSLVHSFNWNFTVFLHAYACLPLPYAARQTAGAALQDIAESGVLFALLMSGYKVINMVGPRKASLHPDDLFLLSNFVSSSDSFRTTESFSPVCLPHYNPNAFVYAYVQYLTESVYLVLISTSLDSFYHLKDCRARVEMILKKSRVLGEMSRSVERGGLRVKDLSLDSQNGFTTRKPDVVRENTKTLLGGPAGLWHFLYRSTYLDQYVASEFTPPLHTYAAQKKLFRAYQRIHFSMHDENGGHHKMQYRRDENYVLMYWRTSDFELYAAFDPLAEKSAAIRVSNLVCQWLRNLESEVFLLGATSFNW